MIQKGTAILDVGGGNLQISLFDKDALVTTQSLKMGSVRIRQRLKELEKTNTNYAQLVEEFIRNDLTGFKRLYLKDREIKNLILMGDFLTETIFREERQDNIITRLNSRSGMRIRFIRPRLHCQRKWILIRSMPL